MFITVGICTYNRAESLRRTLDSLVVLKVPARLSWEVLIINNNSSDHTDQVIASFRDNLPVRAGVRTAARQVQCAQPRHKSGQRGIYLMDG